MASFPSSSTRKLIPRFPCALIFLILVVFALALRAEAGKERSGQPRVYNLIVQEADPIDQLIRERYGRKYEVVEIRQDRTYVWARLTKSRYPNPVFTEDNIEVTGSVRVCFVITGEGRLVDPFVVGSANPLLAGPVLDALKDYRAIPARLNGAPIATVETMKFTFGPPPRRRIDFFH